MASESIPTDPSPSAPALQELLHLALGSQVALVDFTIANQRHDYVVLTAQLCHPALHVFIKLAGPDAPYPCPFERTAILNRLVAAQTHIPMPETLAVDVSRRTIPWCYLIQTYIPGQEWAQVSKRMNAQELANAYWQMGEAVAQLHTIRFPAFGEIPVDSTAVPDAVHLTTALAQRAHNFIQTERLRDLFFSVLERNATLFSEVRQPILCHEDLHGHNILFRLEQGEWRLATILDFDKAWAGHSESDLARLEFWRGMMGLEFWPGSDFWPASVFWSTYEQVHRLEPLYAQRRLIYQLFWCLEYARPTPEHLADTRGVCHALGIAPIEHF